MSRTAPPILEARGITRRFGPVVALDRVSIAVGRGRVHAVLGENGAGKSTLMNVLYGLVAPDSGEMLLEGRRVTPRSPAEAIALGIGMVHQHFSLVAAMSVAENIALAERPARGVRLDRGRLEARVREIGARYGLEVDPRARVGDLSVGVRQRVEIVKALVNRVRLLILDEPTAVLTPGEARDLFAVLRSLREEGTSVLFITHRLGEVREIADRVTVLRRGRVVAEAGPDDLDPARLAPLVVGREVPPPRARSARPPGAPVLEVEDLGSPSDGAAALRASFALGAGEILGIAGVDGNGQDDLVDAVLGARPAERRIALCGEDMRGRPLGARLARGLAHIAGDRHREGLVPGFSVAENLLLKKHRAFALRGLLLLSAIERFARDLIAGFRIAARGPHAAIESLSGGNQQKVVLARELAFDPAVVLAVHPTRGLDAAAARDVQDALLAVRDRGGGVLLVSADLDEVLSLSDRVMVAFAGTFTEVPAERRDPETLGRMMVGAGDAPRA